MNSTVLVKLLFALIFLGSCMAHHTGTIMPSTIISNSNFKVLGQVSGDAKVNYFMGFGGMHKNALVAEAKNNLYQNYKIPQGTSLGNVTIDIKRSFWIIYSERKVTITADLIDFNIPSTLIFDSLIIKETSLTISKKPIERAPAIKIYKTDMYNIGEIVNFKHLFNTKTGKITGIFPKFDKVEITYINRSGKQDKVEIPVDKIEK